MKSSRNEQELSHGQNPLGRVGGRASSRGEGEDEQQCKLRERGDRSAPLGRERQDRERERERKKIPEIPTLCIARSIAIHPISINLRNAFHSCEMSLQSKRTRGRTDGGRPSSGRACFAMRNRATATATRSKACNGHDRTPPYPVIEYGRWEQFKERLVFFPIL